MLQRTSADISRFDEIYNNGLDKRSVRPFGSPIDTGS